MGAKLGVLFIQALNAAALYFSSFLALQAWLLVVAVGSIGIISFTVVAFRLIAIDRLSTALSVSVGTLPALLIIAQVAIAAVGAPLAVVPTLLILVAAFASVARRARRRLAASGQSSTKVPLLLESRFTLGEWLALLSASGLAGYLSLVIYRNLYA